MSLLVGLIVAGAIFFLFIFGLIFLIMRMPTRVRKRAKFIDIHEETGLFIQFPVSRKKYIQPIGNAHEIFPAGMRTKPHPLSNGWREYVCSNAQLVLGKGILDAIPEFNDEKLKSLEIEHEKLKNLYSYALTRIQTLDKHPDKELDKRIDTMGKIREKTLPKFYDPKRARQ